MARIKVIAPEGCDFRIGGQRITDKKPITVDSKYHRIKKALGDKSILLYEEPKTQEESHSEMLNSLLEPVEESSSVEDKGEEKPKRRRGRRAHRRPTPASTEAEDTKVDSDN